MLAALIERDGGTVSNPGIVPDHPQKIREALADDADVILVSGGSSVGQEDYVPRLLADDGQLVIHGIAMRPSSPTGIGRLGNRWVFLLPGNPVSCLCAYDFFAGPAIRVLGGRRWEWPYASCRVALRRKLASAIGRVDYARVQIIEGQAEPLAVRGASMLSSTTRADGFMIVPQDSEGYAEGAEVEVFLYDG
jgi:molybdopterin molybdotransferase